MADRGRQGRAEHGRGGGARRRTARRGGAAAAWRPRGRSRSGGGHSRRGIHPRRSSGAERRQRGRRPPRAGDREPRGRRQLLPGIACPGGASAPRGGLPAEGVAEDKQTTTNRCCGEAGAVFRAPREFSSISPAIKGGQLAAATPTSCRTLAISDRVVGDDLSVIEVGTHRARPEHVSRRARRADALQASRPIHRACGIGSNADRTAPYRRRPRPAIRAWHRPRRW